MDAQVWAEEFGKIAKELYGVELDQGWLIGWFANAIMKGYDVGKEEGFDEGVKHFVVTAIRENQ